MYDRWGVFLFSEFQFAEDELKLELGLGFPYFLFSVIYLSSLNFIGRE